MTTSSPGFTTLSMAAIIASVAPHVTTTFASGSASIPLNRFAFAAIASRKGFAPHVIAYWWCGLSSAERASSTISRGGSKSGNPWSRWMAPCLAATRVISRTTLSGKCWTRSATLSSAIRNAKDGAPRTRLAMVSPGRTVHRRGGEKRVVNPRATGLPRHGCASQQPTARRPLLYESRSAAIDTIACPAGDDGPTPYGNVSGNAPSAPFAPSRAEAAAAESEPPATFNFAAINCLARITLASPRVGIPRSERRAPSSYDSTPRVKEATGHAVGWFFQYPWEKEHRSE